MNLLDGIYTRRSIRRYTGEDIEEEQIRQIMRAGSWAPSGLNNQPWRFITVRSPDIRRSLGGLTKYGKILEHAPVAIAVFTDRGAMYHDTKDHQAIGACLQNMLLAAHGLGLGAVWLGEILKSASEVEELLQAPAGLELMAVVAVGHPAGPAKETGRRDLSELVVGEF